jgi:hypothetical protein
MTNKINSPLPVKPPANLWNRGKDGRNNQVENTNTGMKVDKFVSVQKKQTPLSQAAQNLLDDLRKKFGNVYFMVGDFANDKEANRQLSRGKGEINCIITPDLLEKMASCEETRAKYEDLIEQSVGGLKEMKESIGEEKADLIKNYGISVNSNGDVSYYVMLRDGLQGLNDGSRIVRANSIEELMKRLDEIDEERRVEKARELRQEKFNPDVPSKDDVMDFNA